MGKIIYKVASEGLRVFKLFGELVKTVGYLLKCLMLCNGLSEFQPCFKIARGDSVNTAYKVIYGL